MIHDIDDKLAGHDWRARRFCNLGDLFGGGSTTQTTQTQIDPQIKSLIMGNYGQAQNVANTPFQAYTGERVAGFNPTQIQGQQGLLAAANNPNATTTLANAIYPTTDLTRYHPQTIQAGQLSQTDLKPYMNPFQKDVIDASVAQNQFARDQQGVKDNAAATAAHAFGGTRQAVQNALTTEGYDRNNQQNLAALNSQNFNQAQQAAQYDIGNRYNASAANAANDLSGANMRLNASSLLGSLSNQQLQDTLTRAGVIQGVGNQQQAQQQNVNDAAYQEFLRQINYPIQQQDIRNSALGLLPRDGSSTATGSQNQSPLQTAGQIAGIASLFLSDERTKENITTAGYDSKGRRWVDYNYKGTDPSARYRGVLAQEVQKTDPDAVIRGPRGILMVDYSQLGGA